MDFESLLGKTERGEWLEQDMDIVKEAQVFTSFITETDSLPAICATLRLAY